MTRGESFSGMPRKQKSRETRTRRGAWGAMRVVSGTGPRCRTGACALLLFCLAHVSIGSAKDKHLFVIHVAPPVNPETVQVGYFVTGDFGGVGDFRVDTREQEIDIRLDQTSKPPKTLK